MKANSTLLIIPAYNESENITRVVNGVLCCHPDIPILVIDDGSKDDTSQVAEAAGACVLSLPFNLGYGAALQTGYKYALRKGYAYAVQLDGDGQHDPSGISQVLQVIQSEGADLAIGSRFLGDNSYRPTMLRRIGIWVFGSIVSSLIGQKVTDSTSGFQAMNRQMLRFYSQDFFPTDFPDADILLLARQAGFCIAEVPVKMYENPQHQSMHSGLKPLYYVFKMFLSIFMNLIRKRPSKESQVV